MEAETRTIAIIGGGLSGVVQAKWLLHNNTGWRILLFEARSDFGGVWDVSYPNGVMDFAVCNVPKYLMELTDYPWPEGTIDFPHHSDVLRYIKGYAEYFLISEKVECYFNCQVVSVKRADSGTVIQCLISKSQTKLFNVDYVIVANGHTTLPNYPLKGVEDFNFVSHSATFKNCSQLGLIKKNVLVVGLSHSAVDVAVDLINTGQNQVTVLTRKGSWFAPKHYMKSNTPSDLKLPRIFTYLPHKLQNSLIKISLNRRYFNQDSWEISNKCEPAGGSLVSNDEFVRLVKIGKISVIHGSISSINNASNVEILENNGSKTTLAFDHIIFCTGYKTNFEFLSSDMKSGEENYPRLYLNMIPPNHSSHLAYLGLFNNKYTSPLQIIDLQAQYIACLLSGAIRLPSKDEMVKSIVRQEEHLSRNCKTHRASLFLPSDYRDYLASLMGKTPNFLYLLLSPKTLLEYYFGPITWAGYNICDARLCHTARESLSNTCDRAWGGNWYMKVKFALVTVVAGAGVFLKWYF